MKSRRGDVRRSTQAPCRPAAAATCRRQAFSLIEVLIVAAILLVLTMMYWGSFSGTHKRNRTVCEGNLQKIFIALQIYSNEHSGTFPIAPGATSPQQALSSLVPKYTADTSIFICPGSSDRQLPAGGIFAKHRISYAYYMGLSSTQATDVLMTDWQIDSSAKATGQQIFSTTGKAPGNNHKSSGGNLLLGDGHTERSPALVPFAIALPAGVTLLNPAP